MLSDSEDEFRNEELHKITINEHYAKAFQYRKEREELEQLKAKLGSDVSESDLDEEEDTDSESAESEDEDGEELTPAVDAAILRTLARIKQKDPSIYESGKSIFEEEQEKIATRATTTAAPGQNKKKDKSSAKPVTLRQAALDAQLNSSRSPSPEPLTHVQEQQALRKETISAFHSSAHQEEGAEEDDFLVPREKTKDEQEREEEEYRAFLEREVGDLKDIIGGGEDVPTEVGDQQEESGDEKKKKKRKKKKGVKEESGETEKVKGKRKSREEEDQEFLMNYILNRGWIDKSKNHIPTYKEITSKPKSKSKSTKHKPQKTSDPEPESTTNPSDQDDNSTDNSGDISDASSSFSLADAFESSYNFRFEEPNSAHIPSFPRSIPTLVRREDTKRKEARERRKARKEEEMEKKREEVRRLKALKMREVRRKLELVGREAGLKLGAGGGGGREGKVKKTVHWGDDEDEDVGGEGGGEMDVALEELDLEGDWDPEKHDKQMAGLFGGGEEEGEGDGEDVGEVDEDGKPVWKDDIDIGDIQMLEDEDVFQPSTSSKDKKKKKKKKKKREGLEQEDEGVDIDAMDADVQALKKELGEEEEWDGTEEMRKRKLDEYMEEVYNLEFNDMVGDLPTRFKYLPVASQTYSLSPVEILLATDKELNEFMSIKKYAPYKNDARKWDAKRQQNLKELKTTLIERAKNGGWLAKDSADNTSAREGGWREPEGIRKVKKRKGKKERMKAKAAAAEHETIGDGESGESRDAHVNGLNLNRAKASAEKSKEGRVEEQGRKRKRDAIGAVEAKVQVQQEDQNEGRKPKKRRRKHRGGGEGGGD